MGKRRRVESDDEFFQEESDSNYNSSVKKRKAAVTRKQLATVAEPSISAEYSNDHSKSQHVVAKKQVPRSSSRTPLGARSTFENPDLAVTPSPSTLDFPKNTLRPPPLTMSFTFDPDLFHYHRYNNIGDGSLSIIGVFSASSHHEYAIRLYYSEEQHLWLAECGPDFEQAVLTDAVLPFFEELYELYFAAWPEDQSADKEQQKIEIFSLYIMGLKQMWLYHG
ncbi:uncharacterized protein ARMOST_09777 [Armillaria ostoyae]|uniref:Uncharacterized protein n=1 Tax=Armillaria ostoyae TaxID=47428 RepID=A0A284RCF3_ARMOS|nr:uncharacterized protein ARMOST_09777 [Armillaria ostoyae]